VNGITSGDPQRETVVENLAICNGCFLFTKKNQKVNFPFFLVKRKPKRKLRFSSQRGRDSNPRCSYPHTNFPGLLLQPLGHLSNFVVQRTTKKMIYKSVMQNSYCISPRKAVSNMVLKTVGETFCPKRYINLVMAASVVISFPDIMPIFFSWVLVSY
jgi:hypothetical protein